MDIRDIPTVFYPGTYTAMLDSMIGKKVGEFIIEERLGQGAMAVVYKAFESSINRHVALKVIRLDEGQGQVEEFRQRFAREAEVIARLEHIHILPIYAYGINDEIAYLAMRWLKGGSLSETLKRERPPLERTANIFRQIALGLAFAHSKGIVHRDLKPSNIMLDDAGNAYLTDFGLAKLAEGSGELTKSGNIVGTPAYMSPEQLRGEPLDHRSDIYSLGVILYNMVAGRLPFDTTVTDLVSIIYQHLEKPPIPPSEFNPGLSPAVEAVILRALQKDRKNRFDSAVDMSKALNLAIGLPPGSSENLEPFPVPYSIDTQNRTSLINQKNWQRGIIFAGAAAISLLILIAVLVLVQTTNTNAQLLAVQTTEAQTAVAQSILLRATGTALQSTPVIKVPTVLPNVSKASTMIVPDDETIQQAIATLGDYGFVAYIACTQDTEFHAGLAREITDIAKKYGLNYRLYDSQADAYREVTLVERARAEGASALIICPLDINLLSASLASAQAENISLVFHADNIPSYGGVMVGGDAYMLGLAPGQFAGKLVRDEMDGHANVIILDYPDRADIVARADGLENGLKEFAPNANLIGRYLGATREFGKESVEKLLQDGVKFDVILSINDAGAFGAIEAMEEAGIDPNSVRIVSIDAEALAVDYIRKGYFMRGSVQATRIETAQALINSTIQLLAGATIPELILVPPGDIVTKESLESVEAGTPTPQP